MPKKQKNAYFISHNGLGDNITNIGAVNFLLKYYENIYFFCKEHNKNNVKLFFEGKSVILFAFFEKDFLHEISEMYRFISMAQIEDDIFVSGLFIQYYKSRITHPKLLKYVPNDKNYSVDYCHIKDFYHQIGLDLSIYCEYFDIPSTDISKKYYDEIKNLKIIFVHSKASSGEVDFNYVYDNFKNNKEYIIICANKNMYNPQDDYYSIANNYINLMVAHYIDIIKKSELFYMVDSCFFCIAYILTKTNIIEPTKLISYRR